MARSSSTWIWGIGLVLLVAAAVRLAFGLRPPPFLTPDSQGYYMPGWELAHGLGFGPELRRTPGYPLFIGLVVFLMGDDLRAIVLAQHALGVLTAGVAYGLGRVAFGPLAGLVAGLAVGLSGPLLIYEHYVLTESLFTCLLAVAVLLALLAVRQPSRWRLLASGVALAAAALTRPVADVLVPLVALLLFSQSGSLKLRLSRVGFFSLGFGLLLIPWMGRNLLTHGTFSPEGALGQALIGRTVRHDDHDKFYNCTAESFADGRSDQARRIICEEAATAEPSGGTITQRVRAELGLTQAETSDLLRQVALAAIVAHPAHYIVGSLDMAKQILVGKRETVIAPWRERTTRNWDNKWDARLTHLVKNPAPAEGPDYRAADALVSFFQPYRWRLPLGLLLILGSGSAAVLAAWRRSLIIPLAAGSIVLASAALDGNVWRYRYPIDPLMAAVAGGGVQALWLLGNAALRRLLPVSSARLSPAMLRRGRSGDSRRGEAAPIAESGT